MILYIATTLLLSILCALAIVYAAACTTEEKLMSPRKVWRALFKGK